VRYSVRYGLTK